MSAFASTSLEGRARLLAPVATLVLAALFDLAPIPDASISAHAPQVLLSAAFFWSLRRPELVPPLALFGVALASDLAGGALIGLTPALLLILRQTTVRQRRLLLASSPVVLWLAFASYAAGVILLRWLAASLLDWHAEPKGGAIVALLLTALCWPIVQMLLGRVQAILPKVRHAAGG